MSHEFPKSANDNEFSNFEKTNIEALEKYNTFLRSIDQASTIDDIKEAVMEYAVEQIDEIPQIPNPEHGPKNKVLISFSEENEGGAREWNEVQPLSEVLDILAQMQTIKDSDNVNYLQAIDTINQIKIVPLQGRLHEILFPTQEVDDTKE